MSDVAHTCFVNAHPRQRFGIFQRLFANVGNNFFSLIHRNSFQNGLRLFRCLDRVVHIGKNSFTRFRFRSKVHFGDNFFYNVLNHLFVQHCEISLNISFPNAASAVSCSAEPPLTPRPPTILPSDSKGSPPPKITIFP